MKAAIHLSVVAAMLIGTANAETPREAYEGCLAATMDRILPTVCGREDVIAKMIIYECTPQLLTLVQSMPPPKTLERAALPEITPLDETDHITSYLMKHWGLLACTTN
ncbi:hypothetical protein EH240_31685 [Mesorhizobium tamadayense]|uniref:Rap1a immunity protein domain-containing protein n=1 Tax=Mesorhizobium tamadayense TaxID=425306 RepID=A0A3P3F0A6_9HYPH|nr:hypothetical protein [Mesorhizobium tamadayense]RRH91907.1 hypothetical protein EH240_31685 [Mesorhizobium tamadayense]